MSVSFRQKTVSLRPCLHHGDLITIPLIEQNWKFYFCLNSLIYFFNNETHLKNKNKFCKAHSFHFVRKIMAKLPSKLFNDWISSQKESFREWGACLLVVELYWRLFAQYFSGTNSFPPIRIHIHPFIHSFPASFYTAYGITNI